MYELKGIPCDSLCRITASMPWFFCFVSFVVVIVLVFWFLLYILFWGMDEWAEDIYEKMRDEWDQEHDVNSTKDQ